MRVSDVRGILIRRRNQTLFRLSSFFNSRTVAFSLCTIFAIIAFNLTPSIAEADGFPPFWDNSTGAVHYQPVAWPTDAQWMSYTHQQVPIRDKRTADPSNGGRAPQNYVNVSSACTDQSLPSVSWFYDQGIIAMLPNPTLFFRWRVEQIPNTYATGPSPGAYSSVDPWKSAQWTVLLDTDGDGYREFAVHVDGASGTPSAPIDMMKTIYSNTPSQSIDITNPDIHLIAHNPTAFIEQTSSRILNFRNSRNPSTSWPNGSAETTWDYGTTRSTNISTVAPACEEYYIDYQIPVAMLDATAYGGPKITPDTPFCMAFVTANSNTNPLQKDVVFDGNLTLEENNCVPCGDLVTLNSSAPIVQPVVDQVTASGCNTTTLTARVRDAIAPGCTDTLTSVDFYYYYDRNGNGIDDDGSSWTLIGPASVTAGKPNEWIRSGWNTTTLRNGQYLIGVRAQDDQGNITWSYVDPVTVSPPNFGNPSPEPGIVYDKFINSCGRFASMTKTVNPASTTVGLPVQFTITINNQTGSPLTVTSVTDQLPPGFTYVSTNGGTLAPPAPVVTPNPRGDILTWTLAPAIIASGGTGTLLFTANVSSVTGTYSNVASAVTVQEGTLKSNPVNIGVGSPRLTISKTASTYNAQPNDAVTYTITYANDSPVNTTGVTITDPLPAGLDFVAASSGGTYNSGTRTITWNIGSLASLEGPYTVSFTATINKSASIKMTNTATISSNETAPAQSSASIYVQSPLNLEKTANKALVYPAAGGSSAQVTYTIYYQNNGTNNLTGVTIIDAIPSGFYYISHTNSALMTGAPVEVSGDGYGNDNGICETAEPCIVTWTASGPLTPGASGTVTLTVQAVHPYTGSNYVVNTASIASNEAPTVTDTALVGVVETGGVCRTYFFHDETENVGFDGIQKTSDTISPVPADTGVGTLVAAPVSGGPFLEVLRFYNPIAINDEPFSNTINTRIYIDRIPGNGITIRGQVYDYDPVSGSRTLLGTYDQNFNGNQRGLHEFNISPSGTLLAGHRLLWIFLVRSQHSSKTVDLLMQYDGTVANTLSGTTPATFANSHARLCASRPALVLTKDVDKKTAVPGDSLQYTLNFANLSVDSATGSRIKDILPTGTTFVSATLNGGAVTPIEGAGCQICTFNVRSSDTGVSGQITGGQSGVLIINATINNPLAPGISSLTNTAELTSNETDPVTDAVTTNIGLSSSPNITIMKSASITRLIPGDTVTYTLRVVNTSAVNASTIQVTDVLPATAYYTYVAGSISGGTSRSDAGAPTLTWTINTLTPGASSILTYQMRVAASGVPPGVTSRSNTATATEATTGPYSSNTVTVSISTNANLSITKTVSSPARYVDAVGTGTGAQTVFDATLTSTPVQMSTLRILVDGTEVGADSGTGVIIGTNLKNSTINYTTGALHLEFISAPANGAAITASYFNPASPGDILQYSISVSNIGAATATDVLVIDPVPANTTYQVGSLIYEGSSRTDAQDADNAYFDGTNNRILFSVGDLAVSQTRTMNFSVRVNSPLPNGTTALTNTATASAGNASSKNGRATFNAKAAPILSLTKNAPTIIPFPLTTLAANAVLSTTITVNSTQYINVLDVISVNGVATRVTAISGNQLTLSNPVTGAVNDPVRGTIKYTLLYQNSGTAAATNVVVRDPLAAGLTYLSAFSTAGCVNTPPVTCNIGTLAPGQSGAITLQVFPTVRGTYLNYGTMLSNELTTFNSNTTTTVVGGLAITKRTTTPNVVNNPADGADTATYVISVTNQLTALATGVNVTDILSAGFTYRSTTSVVNGACMSNPVFGSAQPVWTGCIIAGGATMTITFVADIAPTVIPGVYQNALTATSATHSVLPFDELATTAEDVTITIPNDLKITKTVQSLFSPCIAGLCQVTYLITATNIGTNNAANVSVTDVLPGSLTYQSSVANQGAYDPGSGVWTVGNVNASNFATLQITAIVNNFSSEIQNCASLTASTPADTNAGNNTGCRSIIPTRVTLSSFGAYEESGRVVIAWETASEIDTAGFYLFRLDESGANYIRINSRLLPSVLTSPQGGSYRLIDRGAVPGGTYTYLLVEVESSGAENRYGPFAVSTGAPGFSRQSGNAAHTGLSAGSRSEADRILGERSSLHIAGMSSVSSDLRNISNASSPKPGRRSDSGDAADTGTAKGLRQTDKGSIKGQNYHAVTNYVDADGTIIVSDSASAGRRSGNDSGYLYSDYVRKPKEISALKKERIASARDSRQQEERIKHNRRGDAIKIPVSTAGLYYLDAAEIAGMMNMSPERVLRSIRNNSFVLGNKGKNISYIPAEGHAGIYFYADRIDSIYTKDNVYWLHEGTGRLMETVKGKGPAPVSYRTFTETVHAEEDRQLLANSFMEPESDYWLWDYIVAGNPVYGTRTFNLEADGVADIPAEAILTVRLRGFTDTAASPDHHVAVRVNGTAVGEDWWDGTDAHTLVATFSQQLLYEGANTVEVTGLLDTGAPYGVFYLDSFDLTYQRLSEAQGDTFTFTASDASPVSVYGFTGSDISVIEITVPARPRLLNGVTIDNPDGSYRVSFTPASGGSRYLVTTSNASIPVSGGWADTPSYLRSADNHADYLVIAPRGLIKSAQSLADYRISQGLETMVVDVEDIMDEFNHGISSPHAIRDFLSYAFKNWQKHPRYVVLAGEGSYDYKNNLGFGDNLIPPLIVKAPMGLFPSDNLFADVDGDHLPEMAVGRIPAVSADEMDTIIEKIRKFEMSAGSKIVMLADNPDDGGNFPADSNNVASLITPGYPVTKIYLSDYPAAYARQTLLDEINSGALLVNYIGHAAYDRLAQEGLIRSSDVASLGTGNRVPVVAAMTCYIGQFALPGYDSLSEVLLLRKDGGASAVWSPSGLSFNALAVTLDQEFFTTVFLGNEMRLGDMILKAMKGYINSEGPSFMLDIYNLQGDPAMSIW